MTLEDNKALIRRYLDAWGRGDASALGGLLHPEAVTHVSAVQDEPAPTFEPEACAAWHEGFSDTSLTIHQLTAEGDRVAVYWTITAAHTAEFVGMPPTQNEVHFGGLEINRVADGAIVEIWRLSDTQTLMSQLGA
ncbi:MAG: ester cyclase [Chloroflexi bacterium]|nr:ester cyclase [Chloroflexota bacterium]